jgi:TldD protein
MASLLSETFGTATEVDRAVGYEANADGTSYLGPILTEVLGTPVAAPLVTVTANRSAPAQLATARWDDEGVEPNDFTLVQAGQLIDYQTTRESAAWLAPWYHQQQRSVRSHGCANAPSALELTMEHTPNLVLNPTSRGETWTELLSTLDHGIALHGLGALMDQQHLNGLAISGKVFEIKRGRRTARLSDAAFLFRSPEFWKSITALGGPASTQWFCNGSSTKGEPQQATAFSVNAVPAIVKNIATIDLKRKA